MFAERRNIRYGSTIALARFVDERSGDSQKLRSFNIAVFDLYRNDHSMSLHPLS